jgi:hypothetical protein
MYIHYRSVCTLVLWTNAIGWNFESNNPQNPLFGIWNFVFNHREHFSGTYPWHKMRPACIVFLGVGIGVVGFAQSAHMTDRNTLVLQSCTVPLTAEHGYCSDTSVQCSEDSSAVISIKIEQEEPIAISFSPIKDEPEVSLQTFQQCVGLPPVIMLFHINLLTMVNGNGLYIFTVYVEYRG